MPGKCSICLGNKASFHFYCPNCLCIDTSPKWDAPFTHREIYEREGLEIEKITAQRELALTKQDLKAEQEIGVQAKWIEWRALSKEEQETVWLGRRSAPDPQKYGVSPEGAERLVAQWLDYLGEENITVTQYQGDGGIDIRTKSFCCQVKNYDKTPVGATEVREIFGVATAENSTAMIFTSSSLTPDAAEFCERNGIVAIKYSAEEATLIALSSSGEKMLKAGEYFDPVEKSWLICGICETVYPNTDYMYCDFCREYKAISTIEEWETQEGKKLR